MSLKNSWKDKIDGEDYVLAEDINEIANSVISLEEDMESVGRKAESANSRSENNQERIDSAETDIAVLNNDVTRLSNRVEENLNYVKNNFSNALIGFVSGNSVRIDDVSPINHTMSVKVSGVEDASAVKVTAWGKNFFENDTSKIEQVTYTGKEGGNGTRFGYAIYLPVGTYTVSAKNVSYASEPFVYCYINTKDGAYKSNEKLLQAASIKTHTFTIADGDVLYIVNAHSGNTLEQSKTMFNGVNVQVEQGETATNFEPYVFPTEYTPDADGTVDGVTSVYPTTTLTSDTVGAVVDVEYNRDLNKAVSELERIVNALLGG